MRDSDRQADRRRDRRHAGPADAELQHPGGPGDDLGRVRHHLRPEHRPGQHAEGAHAGRAQPADRPAAADGRDSRPVRSGRRHDLADLVEADGRAALADRERPHRPGRRASPRRLGRQRRRQRDAGVRGGRRPRRSSRPTASRSTTSSRPSARATRARRAASPTSADRETQIDIRGDIISPQSILDLPIAAPAVEPPPPARRGAVEPVDVGARRCCASRDVASVVDGYEPRRQYASVNGINGVFLQVQKASDVLRGHGVRQRARARCRASARSSPTSTSTSSTSSRSTRRSRSTASSARCPRASS